MTFAADFPISDHTVGINPEQALPDPDQGDSLCPKSC